MQQWSPEQIACILRKQEEFQVSFQTIYRHVCRDWNTGGELHLELRRRYKRRKRHYGLERHGRLHARAVIERWRREYNEERPKKALDGLTPSAYAKHLAEVRLQ